MYLLYQLGDAPLYDKLVGSDGDPIEIVTEYEWDTPDTRFFGRGGRNYNVPSTFALQDEVVIEADGFLIGDNKMSATRVANRIRSFAGRRRLPIVVAQVEETADDKSAMQNIRWLIGYGIIVSTESESAYGGEDARKPFYSLPFTVEIVMTDPFRQMETAFWEYRFATSRSKNNFAEDMAIASGGNAFWHPKRFSEIDKRRYFVKWIEEGTLIDTAYWGLSHLNEMSLSGVGSDFIDFQKIHIYSDEDIWTLHPKAIYAFKNLTPYGTISIGVKLKTGLYFGEEIDSISTLDLVQLDADLNAAGYSGLQVDDIVYTGEFFPSPGFIYRNGAVLSGIRPRWSYTQAYPGWLSNGYSVITFTKYLNDAKVAYKIDYGVQ